MSKRQKLLEHCRNNPAGVSFDELVGLLRALGFEHVRTAGSHQMFAHETVPSIVNLQRSSNGMAKPYQVRQVLDLVDAYGLEVTP